MKDIADKNFDDYLKVYDKVENSLWDGMKRDGPEDDDFYFVGPIEMRPFLHYDVFKMNYDQTKSVFDRHSLKKDLTQSQHEELISILNDSIGYCTELNREQYNLTKKYLLYWNSKISLNPESELYKRRISYLQTVKGELDLWFESKKLSITDVENNETITLSNELAAAHFVIKKLRLNIKALTLKAKRPNKDELKLLIDDNRFTNGKVNLTKIGKSLGKHSDTIKRWIQNDGLSEYANLR